MKKEKLSNYFEWVKAVWTTSRGKPLDFIDRPYLVEVYKTQAQKMVFTKAAQMGLSERSISEAVWICDQLGKNVLFVFPAAQQLADFVQARLDPVLETSDYLKDRTERLNASDDGSDQNFGSKKLDKIGLKRIGRGFLYLRGSTNEKQIISIDADAVFGDERDRFKEANMPFLEKRLLASDMKWMREISTPTIPGKGIHASYLKSDQRIWEIECKKCGTWQELDFHKHVDFEHKTVKCQDCKAVLDRKQDGRWRALNPTSKTVGFKINGLYNPNVSIAEFIEKYQKAQEQGAASLQQFYNQDLGLPYEAEGHRLTRDDILRCVTEYYIPVHHTKTNMYCGVDVGAVYKHVVVLQKLGEDKAKLIWAGTVKNFEGPFSSLEQIMEKFDIKIMVIDKKPETTKVREFSEKYPGRVYACTYPSMNFTVKDYYIFDDIDMEIKADRTMSLDYLVADLQGKKIELPANIETVKDFVDQMTSSVRTIKKDERAGQEVARWSETGPDHFFHTFNYARLALTRGVPGEALMQYYTEPQTYNGGSFMNWLKINAVPINANN